jgi:hypothetical protein
MAVGDEELSEKHRAAPGRRVPGATPERRRTADEGQSGRSSRASAQDQWNAPVIDPLALRLPPSTVFVPLRVQVVCLPTLARLVTFSV